MRWIIVFVVVFCGCVATLPGDDSITADIACETAREVLRLRQMMPPAPVSDDCDNCVDGYVGDGRIKVVCPVCKGTGKKPKSVLTKPAPTCTNGTCNR